MSLHSARSQLRIMIAPVAIQNSINHRQKSLTALRKLGKILMKLRRLVSCRRLEKQRDRGGIGQGHNGARMPVCAATQVAAAVFEKAAVRKRDAHVKMEAVRMQQIVQLRA